MRRYFKEATNKRVVIAAAGFLVVGLCCLLLASVPPPDSAWRSIFVNLGSFFVATVAVAFVWELVMKRSLLNEIESYFKAATLFQQSGLVDFEVGRDLIAETEIPGRVDDVDLLLGFSDEGEALFHQRDELEAVIRRINATRGARLRVVIPSHESQTVRTVLANRLQLDKTVIERRLKNAAEAMHRSLQANVTGGRWELRCVSEPTFFSYARFGDDGAVLLCKKAGAGQKAPKLRLHRQAHLPTTAGNKGPRDLFEFFEREFEVLFERGRPPGRL